MNPYLYMILVGLVAGFLAGLIMRGGGFGILGNIIVGVLGAIVGGVLFDTLGIAIGSGFIGSVIPALVGAVVLLFVIGLIKKRR
ncbi:MAG: GlsB/YeaQ/YmgE family stress response membrane protein [Verrucomicrobiae bacterium]|nr:GlsB/YeaQ/YmgE family stress response membrane protein [Verrucomicrobiae bacterium]MCP5541995.1 GlsB/YeaQ/YmgE family stress response membrane protein [Akkermansiaceae bacterium]